MAKEDNLSDKERQEVRKEIDKRLSKRLLEKAKKPLFKLHSEFKQQASTAIITAFGLVIALAWKDVITAIMPQITAPGLIERYPYIAVFYTALLVTILAVVGILLISLWAKKPEDSK